MAAAFDALGFHYLVEVLLVWVAVAGAVVLDFLA
jgi:hypothetical protein